ncbi:DNA topoisomerase 3-alpha [Smittium mucronatum]|uniref:DNA topoisomerase n=1 Tax=Smittium mucronatum TaxID=133383 RepID=A0A1R0GUG0_9FUNG|nr:DNA topoisomerase 3-alpha [Smittium mucronatum]
MTSLLGHVSNTKFSNPSLKSWKSCDPAVLFDAEIVSHVSDDMIQVAKNLANEARGCKYMYIWTDCDREGEKIGSSAADICIESNPRITIKRAREVHSAMQSPDTLDPKQVDAVEARMELDLRIGAILTRFQTLLLQDRFDEMQNKVISYGSCQFPTLGFVVDRYRKVKEFVPEETYSLTLEHVLESKEKAVFKWKRGKLYDLEACFAIYANCLEEKEAVISNVTSSRKLKYKPIPLSTVEMEKMSIRYLKMNSQKTMKVAESLYNKGFISYPRTETDMFDKTFNLKSLVEKHKDCPKRGSFASKLINNNGFEWPRNGKNNDKAHPPIHPTCFVSDDKLSQDEKLLYDFIVRRFLACCSKNAIGYQTVVTAKIKDEFFTATGLMICEYNFLEIYKFNLGWSEQTIPMYNIGETFVPSRFELTKSLTSKPNLLDEADLVDIMNKSQIGTDATIHDHIKKIIDREYVIQPSSGPQKGRFLPSNLGFSLVEGYDDVGLDLSLSKPYLRREMETHLKNICDGVTTKAQVVKHCIKLYRQVYLQTVGQKNKICEAVEKNFGIRRNSGSGGYSPDYNQSNGGYIENDTSSANEINGMFQNDSGDDLLGKCPLCLTGEVRLIEHGKTGYYLQCSQFLKPRVCKFNILVPNRNGTIVSAKVSFSKCQKCEVDKNMINFKFLPGSLPPVIPLDYQGCLFGCNEMLNEILNVDITSYAGPPPPVTTSIPTPSNVSSFQGRAQFLSANRPNENSMNQTERLSKKSPRGSEFGDSFSSTKKSRVKSADDFNHQSKNSVGNGINRRSHTMNPIQTKTRSKRASSIYENSNPTGNNYLYSNGMTNSLVKCDCGLICDLKTAKKAGANQGRQFYSCPRGSLGGCTFFEWYKDENTFIEDLKETNASSGVGASPKPKCFCGMVATEHVVTEIASNSSKPKAKSGSGSTKPSFSKSNLGRRYLKCPKSSKPCGYFRWIDSDDQAYEVK